MIISVQFKNKNLMFCGKTYNYQLAKSEKLPQKNDVIRMLDTNFDYVCYGTRVKVVDIIAEQYNPSLKTIYYIPASMEE